MLYDAICLYIYIFIYLYIYTCIFVTFLDTLIFGQPGFIHPGFLNDMSCNPLKKPEEIPRTSILMSLNLGAISHGLILI